MSPTRSDAARPAGPACVVVGAGVLGVVTAYRLAQAGARVTLVDAGDVGGGTSAASFAHVNASYAGYWTYVELRRAGIEGLARMRGEPGGAPWWHETGYLCVQRSGESFVDLDAHVERLLGMGYPVERVDPLSVSGGPLDLPHVAHALRFPGEGWVDLPAQIVDLVGRLRVLGVSIRTDDAVVRLPGRTRVDGVGLRSGAVIPCDQVVVCAGRWTDDILALAGLDTHLVAHEAAAGTPVPGLLVVTDPVAGSVEQVVSVDDLNYRPMGDGRTMVWSGLVDRSLQRAGGLGTDPETVHRLAWDLLRSAAGAVPALVDACVEQALVTARSMPADGLPIVGPLSQVEGVYVVLAHAAATLAPALGDIVAAEILRGEPDARLDVFRPTRFDSAVAPHPTRERREVHDLAGQH